MEAAEPYVVVYRSKWKAIRSILIAVVFLAISIAMHFDPGSPNETFTDQAARILGGWFGPPAFLLLLILSVKQLLSKKPVLLVDEAGISIHGLGPIEWSEILELRVAQVMNRRCLGVVPYDVETLLARMPTKTANSIAWNLSHAGVASFVSETALPMKVEELLAVIRPYSHGRVAPAGTTAGSLRDSGFLMPSPADHLWDDEDAYVDNDDDTTVDDELYNQDLQAAITAVTKDNSHENRQELYRILMRLSYCIPLSSPAEPGNSQPLTVTKNENGEVVLPAFSDPNALHRWVHPPSMLVMTADKLFETAIANDFAEILINPAGPAGGKLTREEYTALSRGIIPY
jgi:hypothetical protein